MGTCQNQKNYSIARKESYQTVCDVYVKMTSFTNVKMMLFKSNIQILDNVFGRHLDPDSASLLATNPIKRESLFLHIQSMKRVNTPQRSSIKFDFLFEIFLFGFQTGGNFKWFVTNAISGFRSNSFFNSILVKLKLF